VGAAHCSSSYWFSDRSVTAADLVISSQTDQHRWEVLEAL